MNDLFQAMYSVGGGPCMDDDDTDPHVSMSRGVKFKSSYHSSQYYYKVNLEVAVWQAMYPKGVVMGTSSKAAFSPERAMFNRQEMGYGNLYFFFDRANITKHFSASRDLSSTEEYYATLMSSGAGSSYYQSQLLALTIPREVMKVGIMTTNKVMNITHMRGKQPWPNMI